MCFAVGGSRSTGAASLPNLSLLIHCLHGRKTWLQAHATRTPLKQTSLPMTCARPSSFPLLNMHIGPGCTTYPTSCPARGSRKIKNPDYQKADTKSASRHCLPS